MEMDDECFKREAIILSLKNELKTTNDRKKKREIHAKILLLERNISNNKNNNNSDNTPTPNVEDVKYQNLKQKKEEKLFSKKQAEIARKEEAIEMAKNIIPYNKIELSTLLPLLKEDGLTIKEIPADGNCLFASILQQLPLNTMRSSDLRKLIADHLRKEKEFYNPFIDEDYEEYCVKMEDGKSWGGHLEIEIISKLLKINIILYQMSQPQKLYFKNNNDSQNDVVVRICYRKHAYSLGEHYDYLVKGDVGLE